MKNSNSKPINIYKGHRSRHRSKFLKDLGENMENYEILELLLMAIIPRIDVKPLAKELLENFGSLNKIFHASVHELEKVKGVGKTTATNIKVIHSISSNLHKEEFIESTIIDNYDSLKNYCYIKMAHLKIEQLRIIFLDSKLRVLEDIKFSEGTIDETSLYIREVVSKALLLNSASIIIIHNHPSGESEPSHSDLKVTISLQKALHQVSIKLLDHLIISISGVYSFRENGLFKV